MYQLEDTPNDKHRVKMPLTTDSIEFNFCSPLNVVINST